jgi:pimeloyl-ACP methyl ester carboxylesterase
MSSVSTKKSTIVRARKALGLGAVRTGFRLSEVVAPGLGARRAERIWLTVPGRPWVPRRPVPVPVGESFELTVGACAVRGEVWGDPAAPAVYLLHGWGGTRRQLDAFVAPLLAAGCRVVALDAPGHGASGPSFAGPGLSTLPEFIDSVTAAVDRFGPARGVVAHSFGAAALTLAVLDGMKADRLAAVAPMGDPIGFSRGFAKQLGFGERVRTGFLRVLEQRVGRPMSDFDIPSRLAAAPARSLPPLLIVHDLGDREVPVVLGQNLARSWPGAVFRTTTGLGHNRILVDPGTVGDVVAFLTSESEPVSPAPRTPPAP